MADYTYMKNNVKPLIDPSTLAEEQRLQLQREYRDSVFNYIYTDNWDRVRAEAKLDLLESLFGSTLFEAEREIWEQFIHDRIIKLCKEQTNE